jgi:hypothetical protein
LPCSLPALPLQQRSARHRAASHDSQHTQPGGRKGLLLHAVICWPTVLLIGQAPNNTESRRRRTSWC